MGKITQDQTVLNRLQQGKTISQAEAIELCDCYRLSAVIDRLRKAGYNIVTHNEKNLNSKGTHARYELISEVKS
jgi:biotin operon repressor